MRPAFEEELEKVQSERGHGCIITGEDIKVIIPKVHAVQHSTVLVTAGLLKNFRFWQQFSNISQTVAKV